MFRRYGDIVYFKLGSFQFAMLNDAESIEQVLQTESKNFTKSTGYERFKLIIGNGLLVSEGDIWKRQRRLMSWAFSSKHIEKAHQVMVQETLDLVNSWKGKKQIDLAEEMNHVALQIICVSLFGKSQTQNSQQIRVSIKNMLSYLQTTRHLWIQILLYLVPVKNKHELALKIEKSLPLPSTKQFFHAIDSIDGVVNSIIENRKSKGENSNLLDAMIQATDSEDQTQMTNQQLRDEVITMLIAGHETTANALTWTWHQLLKYPEVLKKVRSELNTHIAGDIPSFNEISSLSYTRAVLEESIRLYPPFWRISRKNKEATKIKNYNIPAGTNIIASLYTIHRHVDHWPDPLVFRPERFLEEKKSFHRFAYIPFGGGSRICIGSQFAIYEALTILAISLKKYDFKSHLTKDPEYFMSLTLQPKDGCKVSVTALNQGAIE